MCEYVITLEELRKQEEFKRPGPSKVVAPEAVWQCYGTPEVAAALEWAIRQNP